MRKTPWSAALLVGAIAGCGNHGADDFRSLHKGMTEHDVRAAVGPPKAITGRCWLYLTREKAGAQGNRAVVRQIRLCFVSGRLSAIEAPPHG